MAIVIKTGSVVTAPWTVYKCQYGCKAYGKNLCCPPNTPTYKETQDMDTVTPAAVDLAKEMFLDGYYKAIAFGDGGCRKCTKCNMDHCRFPGETVPSMEACGIDVFATVHANGLEIHTLREKGEMQNHFGLILYE